ncbi:MAG: decarboxylase [Boseongicola sp. SB0675_bin_26]|nr:decarboxylase [Boseongicola sp. SB0675_bin_26]
MLATNALGDLLTTLLDRRPFGRKIEDGRKIKEVCLGLLTETDETSARQLAATILNRYRMLDRDRKIAFFEFLNDELDLDAARIAELAGAYGSDPSPENFRALSNASEPQRQVLFRQMNEAPGATAEIVRMRRDLLALLEERPELGRTDHDIVHLLRSWFNRGFLVVRQINWESPASILEKIIAYEAVHEIGTWTDLRRRLQPTDRRCFAFFHPSMPDEPLIFVEVALTNGVPNSIRSVLSGEREAMDAEDADTAVFYSISNCQKGLAGVSFGNSLIKQVARDLSHDLPNIRSFVTLSPIPGLMQWLRSEGILEGGGDPQGIERLAAKYLLDAKAPDGLPLDAVARFHLGNGALVHAIHSDADLSDTGIAQSSGVMVNYLYDLPRIAQNTIQFSKRKKVAATSSVRSLARRAVVAS